MALPTQADLATLGFAHLGEPFANLTAASVTDTGSGEFARLAEPFVAPLGAGTTTIGFTAGAPTLALGLLAPAAGSIALTPGSPTLAIGMSETFTGAIALVPGAPTLAMSGQGFSGAIALLAGSPVLALSLVVQPHAAIALAAGTPTLAMSLNAPAAAAIHLTAGSPVLLILLSASFPHTGPLQVTSVTPNVVGDPTTVVILGSGFLGATQVVAGPVDTFEYPTVNITVVSDTEIHAEFESPFYLATGSHDPVTYDVQVRTLDVPLGSPLNPPGDQITFLAPPTVYSIVPISGTTAANTPYTIYGRNLNPAFLVELGPYGGDSSPVVSADGTTLTGTLITAGFQGNLNDAYPVRVWNRAGPSQPPAPTFTVYPGRVPFTPTATAVDDALSGRFGPAVIRYRFEQRTKSFGFIADLTAAVRSANSPAVIHLDNNQAVARTCDLYVGLPELLPSGFTPDDPDTFNVAVWADVVVPGVGITSVPVGLFHLDDPVLVQAAGYSEWQAKGSDMAFFLAQASSPIPYVVPAGSVYLNVVAGLCRQYGLAENISVIGGLQYTTPFDFVWPAGTTFLAIANELLAGINYYPVWADERGVMQTRFRNDPATETAAVFYRTDAEPKLVAATRPSERSRSVAALFNQISVAVDDPRRVPYTSFRTNADPASPASTVKSGRANFKAITGSDTPGTRAIFNTVMADVVADWLVRDQAAMAVSRTIQTHPDPRRTGREWYLLTLDSYEVQTLWRAVKWDLTLAPGGPHSHTLEFAQSIVVTS